MSSLPESLLHFRTELEDAIRRELEAQATARSNGWGARVLRAVKRRPGRTALALAAVAGVAAAALFVSTPWQSSPGFLERAQAALTPPEGRILHASWTVTRTSRDYGCTVTLGPNELWADLSTPYRYRLIAVFPSADAVDRRSAACDKNQTNTTEVGGTPNASFRFVPPDMFAPNGPGWTGESQDDVPLLREALAEGRAYDEGQAQLDGRVVERIRVYLGTGHSHPRYYYVDRKTFIPVQVEDPDGMLFSTARLGDLRFDIVRHYLTYEYLPRTDHNLDFTDIWAQHP